MLYLLNLTRCCLYNGILVSFINCVFFFFYIRVDFRFWFSKKGLRNICDFAPFVRWSSYFGASKELNNKTKGLCAFRVTDKIPVVSVSVLKKEFVVLLWKVVYFHKFHAGFNIMKIIAACFTVLLWKNFPLLLIWW